MSIVLAILGTLYVIASLLLLLYGLNAYLMIYYSLSRRYKPLVSGGGPDGRALEWPVVTVQLPIYNERNVCERVLRAAAALDYPRERLEIQVLDDSTDETGEIIDRVAGEIAREGLDIRVVRRQDRSGFKAGALAHATPLARGEFIAVFDADFVPEPDFLRRTLPPFLEDEQIAFVQTCWGHVNRWDNALTICQALGIDGHFQVEQPARANAGLFMNFNGTAGIWRRRAIEDVGGWSSQTLTEDLDLSYRVQLAGWKPFFIGDVVVPAEVPSTIAGVRSQQFRWAKGSFQTAILMLPRVWQGPFSLLKKIEAFLHLTNYGIHPMMLILAILALPILAMNLVSKVSPAVFFIAAFPIIAATLGPSTMYAIAVFRNPEKRVATLFWLPLLIIYGTGIAVSNSIAVFEAVVGKSSSFVRTPKKGDRRRSGYRVQGGGVWKFEIFMGIYSIGSIVVSLINGIYGAIPFLMIFASGFLAVGIRSAISMARDA